MRLLDSTTHIKQIAKGLMIALVITTLAAINVNAQSQPAGNPAKIKAPAATAGKPAKAKAPAARAMTKEKIQEAEQLLAGLGYWTGTVDGQFDAASRQALIAFQKVEGRPRTGQLNDAELQALHSAARPTPLESGYAHVEADLDRQVLFIIDDKGIVTKTLSISSGSGKDFTSEGWTRRAVTPTGRFKVYRKVDGWRKAPLGSIYYPNYFLSGIAIHGSPSIPTFPASHGCIRIPVFAAKEISELTPVGTVVIVHDGSATAQNKTVATRAQ
jgi:lipoprotein-anchoring transpeptidase ErfK/SrfK